MEQARLIIAIVLACLVFFIWNYFFPSQQPPSSVSQQETVSARPGDPSPVSDSAVSGSPLPLPPVSSVEPKSLPTRYTVETDRFIAAFSDQGGLLASFRLKQYREAADKDAPFKEMVPVEIPGGNLNLISSGSVFPDMASERFSTAGVVRENDTTQTLFFSWVSPSGLEVVKRYTFTDGHPEFGFHVEIRNHGAAPVADRFGVTIQGLAPLDSRMYGFEGQSAYVNGSLEQVPFKDLDEKNQLRGKVDWVAISDRYFMVGMYPEQGIDADIALSRKGEKVLASDFLLPKTTIPASGTFGFDLNVYLGSKRIQTLKSLGHEMDRVVDFGWFDFIARPCLLLMNFIHGWIPNYGVSIIILTILIKILFWPLGNKSYRSMNEMKKLQPLMAEIREKYKNDKVRMNQETMALYKTYKVNPLSGCLPLLVQMPIFFALYRMLYEAVELRHAPFFGWINDLSVPDRLFDFGVTIPFMEPPIGIPVLTIIMGVTMFLQQKMSPPAGDPAQAKIMLMMPIMFTVIFVNFPAGLVLYWLVNNVVSIGQQYYIQKINA